MTPHALPVEPPRWRSPQNSARAVEVVTSVVSLDGKRVLDLGCDDGASTVQLFEHAHPLRLCGVDASTQAVASAQRERLGRAIDFRVSEPEHLPFARDSFDVVHVRSVGHFGLPPERVLAEALRVAPIVVAVEPTGLEADAFAEWCRLAGGRVERSASLGEMYVFVVLRARG